MGVPLDRRIVKASQLINVSPFPDIRSDFNTSDKRQ